jgi:hypothetical protein
MALSNLSLSYTERNDNTALILVDTTGTDESTDWGVGTNVDYTDIDGSNYNLVLNITITTSNGTETTYDAIDLYSTFGPFVNYDDMEFTITAPMLKVSSSSSFSVGDTIPDGIWEITYTCTNAGDGGDHVQLNQSVLIDGVVRKEVYDMLRQIPHKYELQGNLDDRDTREAMFAYSYLKGMESSAYVSDSEELLTQLGILENIVRNGSNNTW